MRTFAKLLVAVGLALTVSTTASALNTLTLAQSGGTYDGVSANAGDTLVLDIVISGDGNAPGYTAAFAVIGYSGAVAAFDNAGSSESAFNFINNVVMTPIGAPTVVFGDTGSLLSGWESQTLTAGGIPGAFEYTFGTVSFTLTGLAGAISIDPSSVVGDAAFNNDPSPTLGSFAIVAVPEPTTASLLGLGLVGLTVAGRRRRN